MALHWTGSQKAPQLIPPQKQDFFSKQKYSLKARLEGDKRSVNNMTVQK